MRDGQPGGASHGVPVSRRLSAAGVRFSVIRFPSRGWAPLAVGLPDPLPARPDLDRVTAFRTHELRPGWVPSLPRGRWCPSRPSRLLARHPPPRSGQSLHPAALPIDRVLPYEASTRVHAIHPSGLPLACGRPDGTGRPWAFPRASHPADQEPTTHVEVGTGHRARTWNYALNITSVDPPIGSSLTTCDLASHDEQRASIGP